MHGENIGEKGTLLRLLGEIGLDEYSLSSALDNHAYSSRLQQAREKAPENKFSSFCWCRVSGMGVY